MKNEIYSVDKKIEKAEMFTDMNCELIMII